MILPSVYETLPVPEVIDSEDLMPFLAAELWEEFQTLSKESDNAYLQRS